MVRNFEIEGLKKQKKISRARREGIHAPEALTCGNTMYNHWHGQQCSVSQEILEIADVKSMFWLLVAERTRRTLLPNSCRVHVLKSVTNRSTFLNPYGLTPDSGDCNAFISAIRRKNLEWHPSAKHRST